MLLFNAGLSTREKKYLTALVLTYHLSLNVDIVTNVYNHAAKYKGRNGAFKNS